jgi:hypothetical protein
MYLTRVIEKYSAVPPDVALFYLYPIKKTSVTKVFSLTIVHGFWIFGCHP